MRRWPVSVGVALAMLMASSTARAQPYALTLHADGGAGVMLSSRYRDRFDWGGGFAARVGVELAGPLLELRVGGGASWFPVDAQAPGTLYVATAGLRSTIRIDGSAAGGPFVDVDAGLGITGPLARFVLDVGAGWSFAPSDALFVGPMVRYALIVQDPADAVPDPGHLLFFGIDVAGRIEFGGPPPAPPPPVPEAPPPPPDADGDHVPDDVDRCPDVGEDVDGFLDSDGCPDDDNDSDGIDDEHDLCPNLEENRNGYEDDDGCPEDRPPADAPTIVMIPHGTPGRPLEPVVQFRVGSARVSPRFHDAIVEVCQLGLAETGSRLRVIGHADEQGTPAGNQRLGAERAGAVAEQLILCGVAPDRIESVSYGDQRPSCTDESEECRATRRRVEFEIVEQPTTP